MEVSSTVITPLLKSIQQYRQKYYQNKILKGVLIVSALLMALFLVVNTVEYFGKFNSTVRGLLLFSFLLTFCISTYKWVIDPLVHLWGLKRSLSAEELAKQIGKHFPEVGDKLVNTLQLASSTNSDSDLIQASIAQRSKQLMIVKFSDAIQFKDNQKYAKYLIYPVAIIASILLFNPLFFSSSTDRIIHFNTHYNHAPFEFVLQNTDLTGMRNDPYTIQLKLQGEALPENVYMFSNGSKTKLESTELGLYSYTIKSLQKDVNFIFEASGYSSQGFKLKVLDRASIHTFTVDLTYPSYLNKKSETVKNTGNLIVPEGTLVRWHFNTKNTNSLGIKIEEDSTQYKATQKKSEEFFLEKRVTKDTFYKIILKGSNQKEEQLPYTINVIPDQYPIIELEHHQDSTLYSNVIVAGSITDDYGFSKLALVYNLSRKNSDSKSQMQLELPVQKNATNQSFYFQWLVDSLQLSPGDKLDYFVQVWDNDGVNKPKTSRSTTKTLAIPDVYDIQEELSKNVESTQAQIESAINKAKSLEKDLQKLDQQLKLDQQIGFQEKKQIEDILQKREDLLKEIKDLQEKNSLNIEKAKQFNPQSESTEKKMDELQKLMNDLLNDENNKMYEELKKLMNQKQSERLSNMLEKIRHKESNSEKELERTLKLFKKLQLEQKIDQAINYLEKLAEQQEQLADKNEDLQEQKKSQPTNEIKNEQEAIEKAFEKLKEDLNNIDRLGEEINQQTDTQKEEQQNTDDALKDSKEQLNKGDKKSSESQKKAAKSMKKMAQEMQQAMAQQQSQENEENLDAMRDLLENVLTLSFNQEQLMKDFKGISLSDPRFVKLGQEQLKLKDDARIVEDSLQALANRVEQIKTFVTREVNDMNYYINESVKNIKDRQIQMISQKQQFAMTSINNLALMLSDIFKQMQEAMAMSMPSTGSSKKKSKGQSQPSMGDMQMQLNMQMREMGKSPGAGSGSQNAEQLARMAAQQAAIREMLQKMIEEQKGTPLGNQIGKELQEMANQMDKTETEIVNKRITQEMIQRNESMTIRLLEHEKAAKEQGEDNQRKGQTAKELSKQVPTEFKEHLRKKEQQIELLQTIPLNFSPFYKRESDKYFQRIINP